MNPLERLEFMRKMTSSMKPIEEYFLGAAGARPKPLRKDKAPKRCKIEPVDAEFVDVESADALITLSPDQEIAFRSVVDERKSIFITGCAGTGKSALLKRIKQHYGPGTHCRATAFTGVAAHNAGCETLHRFAGIGISKNAKDQLKGAKSVRDNWEKVETLIIDEVSMLPASLFDALEEIARKMRNDDRPFGGITLVLFGDFFQLPPISKETREQFCFAAQSWSTCIRETFELTTIFRQQDAKFIDILSEFRLGKVTPKALELLQTCRRPLQPPEGIRPINIYATNAEVDRVNKRELEHLKGERKSWIAKDFYSILKYQYLLWELLAPRVLELAIGAQVMLLKNLSNELVNGSIGEVVEFVPSEKKLRNFKTIPRVRFSNGEFLNVEPVTFDVSHGKLNRAASRTQIPLKLAYAITAHKSQGLTFDWMRIGAKNVFAEGQFYVMLSRGRRLEMIEIESFDWSKIRCSAEVVKYFAANPPKRYSPLPQQ